MRTNILLLDDLIFFSPSASFPEENDLIDRERRKNHPYVLRFWKISSLLLFLSYIQQLLQLRVVYPYTLHSGHISRSGFFLLYLYIHFAEDGMEQEGNSKKKEEKAKANRT